MTIRDIREYDLRGMGLEEVIATHMRDFDERVEELVERAGELCRSMGGDEKEIEFSRELQRQASKDDREKFLAQLRAWHTRGCQELH